MSNIPVMVPPEGSFFAKDPQFWVVGLIISLALGLVLIALVFAAKALDSKYDGKGLARGALACLAVSFMTLILGNYIMIVILASMAGFLCFILYLAFCIAFPNKG